MAVSVQLGVTFTSSEGLNKCYRGTSILHQGSGIKRPYVDCTSQQKNYNRHSILLTLVSGQQQFGSSCQILGNSVKQSTTSWAKSHSILTAWLNSCLEPNMEVLHFYSQQNQTPKRHHNPTAKAAARQSSPICLHKSLVGGIKFSNTWSWYYSRKKIGFALKQKYRNYNVTE